MTSINYLIDAVSIIELDSLNSAREHSPILKPMRSSLNENKIDVPFESEPVILEVTLSDDGENKMRSPTKVARTQKQNNRLGNFKISSIFLITLFIDLDDHIIEEDFLENIQMIEKVYSSRREIFQQIMEHVFSSKNLHEDAHKNYSRKEVVYCKDTNARDILKNLDCLISALSKEDVNVQLKIIDEKHFLETQFQRMLRSKGITSELISCLREPICVDESQIRAIYSRILKISNHLTFRSWSKEAVKKNLFFFKKLLDRFPPEFLNSNDRAPKDPEIDVKFITVRKLVEKATEAVDTLIADKLKHITILTYDHFIKPLSLLLLLTKRYYTPRPFMMTDEEYDLFKAHHSSTRRKRIIELLTFWVDIRPSDFTVNSDLLALLVIFLESIFKFDKEHACNKDFADLYEKVEVIIEKSNHKVKKELARPNRKVNRVQTVISSKSIFSGQRRAKYNNDNDSPRKGSLSSLLPGEIISCLPSVNYSEREKEASDGYGSGSRITGVSSRTRSPMISRSPTLKRSPFGQRSRKLSFDDTNNILNWDVETIAQQLTLIDLGYFRKIRINQMMQKRWTKPALAEECKEIHDAIQRFNSLSFWVQYAVISAVDSAQNFELLNRFIAIAAECLQLNNFSSSHGIFTALIRLQNTKLWEVSEDNIEHWKTLEKVFQSPTFFQDMEDTLKLISTPAVPSIPFFTNRFFRLQENVNFLLKREIQRKYLKSTQLAQLAEYSLLIYKFQSQQYDFSKESQIYSFLKREYKQKVDIDFEDEDAEEILRKRIMKLSADQTF